MDIASRSFIAKHHRLLFYACWLLLGLMQAALTELQDDEAYYWVYGQYLDWGYFDHPPMIGVLVKMGYAIFPNELGVRLLPLLLNLLSLVLIEKLINRKNPLLFYGIALSIAVIQITGFIAVPDTPLIFFTALFFWFYKKFTDQSSLLNTFLLGLSIALLFYSKYHAVLIVLFTVLSNLKLFTRYQTYLAGIIALLLFAPHLWWQYQHDWVSIRYHLFESNVNPYKFSYTTDYIIGQLLLPGPIAGFILLPAAFLYRPKTVVERALKFTLIGIYGFFLLSSFRGKVEGNWTSPALVCLVVLAHQFLLDRPRWQKILYRLLPVTLLLVLFARVVMIEDIVPMKAIRSRYHAWEHWPAEMKKQTQGLPIIFNNSYQRASKYWFYSGQPTYSLNLYQERKNNYNLWPLEDSLLGKPVYVLDIFDMWKYTDSMKTPIGKVGYRYDPAFVSFAKIHIAVEPKKVSINNGQSFELRWKAEVPAHYANFIQSNPSTEDTIRIGFFKTGKWQKDVFTTLTPLQLVNEKEGMISVNPQLPAGKYYMRIAINRGKRYPTHNSDKIDLIIE